MLGATLFKKWDNSYKIGTMKQNVTKDVGTRFHLDADELYLMVADLACLKRLLGVSS